MNGIGSIMATIPFHQTVGYVAAAYIVVFVLVVLYLAIIARRVRRTERDLGELMRQSAEGRGEHD